MIKVIVLVAAIVLAAFMAVPSFYLKNAVGQQTQDAVKQRLGDPLRSTANPDGSAVWVYTAGLGVPLCVEYTLTFEPKGGTDEPSKPMLSAWDWKMCPLPK